MHFLTPWNIAIAGLLTVPPLVLLYFLRLRRREIPISTTIFWRQAVQDLQVNAPFQKLRRNLLLLLQLLVLLLCAFALGQPLMQRDDIEDKSVVLLIDRSASMNVVEPDGRTRLQRAKSEAVRLVEALDDTDRAMVIAFSDRASVVQPFTGNRNLLVDQIDSIAAGEGLSRLSEAMALAEAHTQLQIVPSLGGGESPQQNDRPVQVTVLSDGRIEDLDQIVLKNMGMEWINVGGVNDNVGFVSLQAEREFERPEIVHVVATVQNFGPRAVEIDVDLFIAGDHVALQTVSLGPGLPPDDPTVEFDVGGSIRAVSFPAPEREDILYGGAGIVEVRLSRQDALEADNRALVVLPAPRTLDVLVVTPGKVHRRRDGNDGFGLLWTLDALRSRYRVMTPEEYEAAPENDLVIGGRSAFDVVVFDDCTSGRLPVGNYFFFGGVPPLPDFARGATHAFDEIFDWDDSHPTMRYVQPLNVDIASWHEVTLPAHAEPIMNAFGGTVLSSVTLGGSRYLISGFALLSEDRTSANTTWMIREPWLVFMDNALNYLAGVADVEVAGRTRPGDALSVDVAAGTETITVTRPDGTTERVLVGNLLTAHYGRTDAVGLYTLEPTTDGVSRFAVNLFSQVEGQIAPNLDFAVGGGDVTSRSSARITNVPVWPMALMAALGLLCVEWFVYSRRVRV